MPISSDEYKEKVDKVAEMSRWQEDLQGLYEADYREVPTFHQQQDIVEDLGEFLDKAAKDGKTIGEFRMDVQKKKKEEAGVAQEYDEVSFYKELHGNLFKKMEKLGKSGFFARLFLTAASEGVKGTKETKKFEENLQRILEIYEEIDVINLSIGGMKDNLSKLEDLLVNLPGATPEKKAENEAKIRTAIKDQQVEIQALINDRVKLQTESSKKRTSVNAVMQAMRRELKEEGREITRKWGGKVNSLFQEREKLVRELDKYNVQSDIHFDKREQIAQRLEEIDLQLEKIKEEILKYKTKNYIFYFERFLGVQSIPILYRYGQESSLATAALRGTDRTPHVV